MRYWRQVGTVFAKDLRGELRTKEALNAALSFSMVILLMFSFGFDPTTEQVLEVSGGLLWMTFAFAGALILNRAFARELPNDCLDVLIASPVPGSALFLGKALANLVLLLAIEAVAFPVFGILYNINWTKQLAPLALVCVLGTWGFTAVGTMFSALTVNIRLREVMLPLLVYPVMLPCLMAAMQLTVALIAGEPLTGDQAVWLRFLVGFDVIFTALSVALIDYVIVG